MIGRTRLNVKAAEGPAGRPPPGLPADDLDSLLLANPGSSSRIGQSIDWLQAQARRAINRGGSTLTAFRLYNRNERVSVETRDLLLTLDEWLNCEAPQSYYPPFPREV